MWDVIVLIPDYFLSIYFEVLLMTLCSVVCTAEITKCQ